MPIDMNALFRDRGITIELDGSRGIGIPFSAPLLETLDREALNEKTRQRVSPGDMVVATTVRDEAGQLKLDANGRPVRAGGYLKLGARNDLTLMVPRADAPGEFTRVDARDTRRAAAALIRMEREARHEVARNAEAHAAAMDAYQAAVARNEQVEAPTLKAPTHDPAGFARFSGFIAAAEAVISKEIGNPFATAEERRSEMMASLAIRNEQRNQLTPQQMDRIAQAESLREQIARLAPEHPAGQQAIVAPYHGDGEALQEGIKRIQAAGGGHFRTGVMRGGQADALIRPLMATFTRMDPSEVRCAQVSPDQRRMFEQVMSRHENEEIADSVRPRIEGIMSERMPGYTCATRFFAHQGVDYLMVNDIGGTFVYAADSAARTQDLDIERLNRIPTEADVPDEDQIQALRATLAELTFDNGAEVDFDFGEEPEDDVLEP